MEFDQSNELGGVKKKTPREEQSEEQSEQKSVEEKVGEKQSDESIPEEFGEVSDELGESSSAMIDRMETGKTEYDTSHKHDIVSSESEDQTVGEESTYSVDWMVDVNDEAQFVPERKAEGEDYGSDFDTFTENSQPVEKEPETVEDKADALTEQILNAIVVMAGEDGKERIFP